MARKADCYYFKNLAEAANFACDAAAHLVSCLSEYQNCNVKEMLTVMHKHEQAGDQKKHEMSEALAKAFVTPIDREDLAVISQNVDDVTDSIEEVLQCIYMYNIHSVTPEAIAFAEKIVECCQLMVTMLNEFANFKKPEKLHNLVVELNHIEEECDAMHIEATRLLETHCDNALDIISWREIYNRMENCADACEHVGDCVDMVVMKNS